MPEPDFESIMKKYRSLLGPGKSSAESSTESFEQEFSGSPFSESASREPGSSRGSSVESPEEMEEPVRDESRDSFLTEERFIRAPLAADPLEPPMIDSRESMMFNNLFSSIEKDEWTPQATRDHAPFDKGEGEMEIDLQAAEFARRLYHYEMDLRQHYNPDLGMYPGQALYVPKKKPTRSDSIPPDKG